MAKQKPLVNITSRHSKVNHLNDSPEKSGDALHPKMDVSIEFVLEPGELAQFVRTRTGSRSADEIFWDKAGEPCLLDVEEIEPDFVCQGKVELVSTSNPEDFAESDAATLKKLKIKPITGRKCIVHGQVRLDPTNYRESLGQMRLAQECKLSFVGSGAAAEAKGKKKQRDAFSDPPDDPQQQQDAVPPVH